MTRYQLVFFVPEDHCEAVKAAVLSAGGGSIGDYDGCCWQVLGQGQFRPGQAASPFIGKVGEVEKLAEYRVELRVCSTRIRVVLQALVLTHPYETPAYYVTEIIDPKVLL